MAAGFNTRQVTLSTTRAKIADLDASRTDLYITNEDAAIKIRVGDSTVDKTGGTAENIGLCIMPGQTLPLISSTGVSIIATAELWCIADSGTPACSVLEWSEF